MSGKHLAAPRRRSVGQRLLLGLGVVMAFLLLASAGALAYLNLRWAQITRYDVSIDLPPGSDQPRNYLIVGSDSRAGLDPDDPANAAFIGDGQGTSESLRTDTIMVLRIDPREQDAWLVSFPRDLYVTISDTGSRGRINEAFAHGREVLVDTIRENFAIPIHHYIEIDFIGFIGLVDAIDGVPFYFDTPVRDPGSGLNIPDAGCVTLDPRQSLALARSRHLQFQDADTGRWRTDPSGDFGRISRQQAFTRKAISRAVSKGLTNPVTLNQLVGVAVSNVGLDPTLDATDILALSRRFASFDADSLQSFSVPADPFRTSAGASVLALNERAAEPIFNIFRGLEPGQLSEGLIKVTAFNGTGEDGLAGDITTALDQIGFTTGPPADAPEPVTNTTLFYRAGSEDAAARVASYLSGPVAFETNSDLGDDQIEVWAGEDFTTLHDQPSPTPPEVVPRTSTGVDGHSEGTTTTTTTIPATTTTAPLGYVPDDPPDGVDCG